MEKKIKPSNIKKDVFTAKQARDLMAQSTCTKKRIYKAIKEFATEGRNHLEWDTNYDPTTLTLLQKELKNNGYEVELCNFDSGESCLKITW